VIVLGLLSPEWIGRIVRMSSLRTRMARRGLRSFAVGVALCCVAIVVGGCGKSKDQGAGVDPAQTFAADKAASARELEEMRRRRAETSAAHQEDIHRETEETFRRFAADRPSLNAVEEVQIQKEAVERLRAQVPDPSLLQSRDVRFNAERTAVCLEVNYTVDGKYVGYRKAFITPDATWVEPSMDDVSHRVFELKMERMGCGAGK
jgi:hypothetical protein